MRERIVAVFRAGFEAQWKRGAWPAGPVVMHLTIAAVMCGLARDALPPFAYALFALSVAAGLIALPLLGDLGVALRTDPAREWIRTLPVSALELRVARMLLVLLLLATLTLAALVPAAFLAPASMSAAARIALVACGLAQSVVLAALLLGVQSTFGERAEAILVLVQTLVVAGIVLGLVVGLRFVPRLASIDAPSKLADGMIAFPPAWFAAPFADSAVTSVAWRCAAWIATAVALGVLAAAPLPPATRARRTGGWLARVLAPARAFASRAWVHERERASFDLVFDALPLEREFVLRTYPMIGIPLAFLVAGARGETGAGHDGLLAVLLFTPATYLPILLAHVPATASPDARWLLETAPVSDAAIANGALKALAVRFLLPLYVLLIALAWSQVDFGFALRLALPGALLSLIVVRKLYPLCVRDLPLSVAASEIESRMDWTGTLLTLAIALTIVAVLAFKYITTVAIGAGACAVLLAVEIVLDRAASRGAREGGS